MANARLAQCVRCKAISLVDNADGIALAVDVAPVDALGFGVAVASGCRLWWVENEPGRPARVVGALRSGRNPSWGPGGSQTSIQKLHVEHGCGAPHTDHRILPVNAPKDSAPATPGAAGAGNRRPAAPGARAQAPGSRSPATPATPRRSEPRGRCGICNRPIHPGVEWWGFTYGNEFVYGEHVEC